LDIKILFFLSSKYSTSSFYISMHNSKHLLIFLCLIQTLPWEMKVDIQGSVSALGTFCVNNGKKYSRFSPISLPSKISPPLANSGPSKIAFPSIKNKSLHHIQATNSYTQYAKSDHFSRWSCDGIEVSGSMIGVWFVDDIYIYKYSPSVIIK